MAISYVATGTVLQTTAVSGVVPLPAGILPGDLLLLGVASKYDGVSQDGEFTGYGILTGAAGAAGVDSGEATVTVYVKTADGTETDVTITRPAATGGVMVGRIVAYRKTTALDWMIHGQGGSYEHTNGGNWSVTPVNKHDQGVRVGDLVVPISAINGGLASLANINLSHPDLTFPIPITARASNRTTGGHGVHLVMGEGFVTAGVANTAGLTHSFSATDAANYPAGATLILRIREPGADTNKFMFID